LQFAADAQLRAAASARTIGAGPAVVAVAILIAGLLIGSFLNVCIVRIPEERSVVTPPSHCPRCLTPIHWYDNVPVLSWLVLRGRCRFCAQTISARYPLVESLTALAWLSLCARGTIRASSRSMPCCRPC
jgi:prepilin signal peptidase PulO-like enzyme (type II secretory pathway)